ncbi:MAG: thioesterase family protein [Aquisalimonadaceae bacterium]
MSLFVRMPFILLRTLCRRRVDPLAMTTVQSRVYPNDLDINLHVNNGRYLTFADLGRVDWFVRTGCMRVAMKRGAIPVIGDATARFIRQMRVFQRFRVETRLLGWDRKWAFLEHRILDGGDRLATIVVVRGMFWHRGTGGIPPAELLDAVGHAHLTSPELPQWVQRWADSLDLLSASRKA